MSRTERPNAAKIEAYRRRRFWDQVAAAAVALRRHPVAWGEELAERHAWESTLADGQESE